MGIVQQALYSYNIYVGYKSYQTLIVSLTTALSILIFLATLAIAFFYVRKLAEKRMMIFLLVLVNLSQLFYLGTAWNVELSYKNVQSNVKCIREICVPTPEQVA